MHLAGQDDSVVETAALLERLPDWAAFLEASIEPAPNYLSEIKRLETHARTSRPLGTSDWLEALEERLGRAIRPRPPGRLRKEVEG